MKMNLTINRILIFCIIIFLVIGKFEVLAKDESSSKSSTLRSTSSSKAATPTTESSSINSNYNNNNNNNDNNKQNSNNIPDMKVDENGFPMGPPQPPLDENGNPLPPPKDENGNPLPPPKDENGNPIRPPLDGNGRPIFKPPSSNNDQNNSEKNVYTYLIIFSVIVGVFAICLLVYIFAYRKKINNKIKRLEQVKDMQSLEASNTRPITIIDSSGNIEDKRDVYSSHSSSHKKTPLYNESVGLHSSTSNESYNYISEHNSNQYKKNKNLGNVKNKYNLTPLEKVKGYDTPYHSTPSFGLSAKDNLDGLYAKTLEPYNDSDDDIILPPMNGPNSMVYDSGVGISPIQTAYSPVMYNAMSSPNSMLNINAVSSHSRNLSSTRTFNHSLPNLTKLNYEMDLSLANNNNKLKPPYISTSISPVSPVAPVSPTTPNSQKSMMGYSQSRLEPSKSSKRRSHSIDITKSKRNSYVERDSIHRKSPGLHSPANNYNRNSAVSDTRSAKSVLIDQMVYAMDMEAESDDTLSGYPIENTESLVNNNNNNNNNNRSKNVSRSSTPKSSTSRSSTPKSSISKMKVMNLTPKENTIKKMTTSHPISKSTTPVSSISSLKHQNTDTSKTITIYTENEEMRFKSSDEEHGGSSSQNNEKTISVDVPYVKKIVKKEKPGLNELNRDFVPKPLPNVFSQESDYCYESNNSYNQSIFEEVKVFAVEEDEDDDLMIQLSQ